MKYFSPALPQGGNYPFLKFEDMGAFHLSHFGEDYIPERFPFRENELQTIWSCIKPFVNEGFGQNLLIYGPPATGKTTSVRIVFRQLSQINRALPFYHACGTTFSKVFIFAKVLSELRGHEVALKGATFQDTYEKTMNEIARRKKHLILTLDDINYVYQLPDFNQLLYSLLRGCREFGVKVMVVLISSSSYINLDTKVMSSLRPVHIKFRQYTKKEMYRIISDRAELAFGDRITEQALKYVSEICVDLRHAFAILAHAASLAESIIRLDNVRKAALAVRDNSTYAKLQLLTPVELEVLKLLPTTSTEIKEAVKQRGLSRITAWRIMDKLRDLELVTAERAARRGNVMVYSPLVDESCLKNFSARW